MKLTILPAHGKKPIFTQDIKNRGTSLRFIEGYIEVTEPGIPPVLVPFDLGEQIAQVTGVEK